MSGWVADVLDFWFRELNAADWFRKDDALDARIRERFAAVYTSVASEGAATLVSDARTSLAAVIVLDQFPRNMFRGSGAAFARDALARDVARLALSQNLDRQLDKNGRLFLYLPFEHSEDALDQARAVDLIGALGDGELTRYAQAHKAIIDRFGRFPHRNTALGRTPTAAELEFLKEPDSSF